MTDELHKSRASANKRALAETTRTVVNVMQCATVAAAREHAREQHERNQMGRPTQKQIKEQNHALLNDARNRLLTAKNIRLKLETDIVAARAVEQSAQEALDQLEQRLNPTK